MKKILGISGSVREGNFTLQALKHTASILSELEYEVEIVDTAKLNLNDPGLAPTPDALTLQEKAKNADLIILGTPEYHGGYSSIIKKVIENLGFPSVLAGKPIALLGVAAGQIGAIKSVESLRVVASHIGGIVLPRAVSLAGVQQAFNDGQANENTNHALEGFSKSIHEFLDK